jgi:hypothetical protein
MARFVDFYNRSDDFQAALLGSLGFSTTCICNKTGLTSGQVMYRLSKASIRRMDYRNGDSAVASVVLKDMEAMAASKVREHIKREWKRHKR